jgi:hypothetical protein
MEGWGCMCASAQALAQHFYFYVLFCLSKSLYVLSLEERTKESKVFKGNFCPGSRAKTADIFSLHAPSAFGGRNSRSKCSYCC